MFAHRGSSAALPEHTLDAYLRAIDEGADGLECDVRLTRDGHLICIHDRRLDRTSDGRGRVSGATLGQLSELDFGSWHSGRPGSGAQPGHRTGVLTLDRLITTAIGAGRPIRLLIETKHPNRYLGVVEQRLVELLKRHDLADASPASPVQVCVMSFSPLAVRRMRNLAPAVPTVILFDVVPPQLREGWAPFGARILGPSLGFVRAHPQLVHNAHARGHQVFVWTVNSADEVELMLRLGVDGIITNDPAFVRSHMRAPG